LLRDRESRLLLRTEGTLINEGLSTAVVTLSGSIPLLGDVYDLGGGRFALPPQCTAQFTFLDGHTVEEWATAWQNMHDAWPPESKLYLKLGVNDQFDDGIFDSTWIEVYGLPIAPIEDEEGGWVVRHAVDPSQAPVHERPLT
jgi:hypothetical protein